MFGFPPAVVATATAVLTAALAAWLVVQRPRFGPTTLRASMLLCAIAYVSLRVVDPAMGYFANAGGPAVGLLLVAVPALTFAFWTVGRLVLTVGAAFRRS